MKSLWQVVRLDIAVWLRTPWAIAVAIIPPIGMTFVIALLTLSVGKQPVALVVDGNGPRAQAMAKIIRADNEAYIIHETNLEQATQLLARMKVTAVIVIPRDFDERTKTSKASIDLTLNNLDADYSDDIRRAVDRSVAEYDAPQLGSSITRVGITKDLAVPNPYRVDVAQRNLRSQDVSFFRSQTVPVLLLLILNVGVLGGALLGSRDHERGTMTLLRLTPISRWTLIAGRLIGTLSVTIGVTVPAVIALMARGIIHPPATHWPAFILLLLATAALASGLGTLLGATFTKSATVAIAGIIVASYLFFLGGGFTTVVFMPNWLDQLSHVMPTRYAIDALRQILFYDNLAGVYTDLTTLSAFAIASTVTAVRVLERGYR